MQEVDAAGGLKSFKDVLRDNLLEALFSHLKTMGFQ